MNNNEFFDYAKSRLGNQFFLMTDVIMETKKSFPMNEIPQHIVDSINNLFKKYIDTESCFRDTLDLIILELKKRDHLEEENTEEPIKPFADI